MEVEQACTEGLKVYYQFESTVGQTMEDVVGNHHGTTTGANLVTAKQPVGEGISNTAASKSKEVKDLKSPNFHICIVSRC